MKSIMLIAMTTLLCASCTTTEKKSDSATEFEWIIDRFDDTKVLRFQVPDFDSLTLNQKLLVYYLSEASKAGRDIIFDQNFKYNLAIRRTLEAVYENYTGDRTTADFGNFETYLKKVWFANGIHHHYSNDKFAPAFSEAYFDEIVATVPAEKLPAEGFESVDVMLATIKPAIFDPNMYAKRVNQADGVDMVQTSANNYYEGVTQAEVESFYAAKIDPKDTQPVSAGLNSKLVKEDGKVVEKPWKVGGMYSPVIEKIVYWLEKAATVAENETQRQTLDQLVAYYKTGDLKLFDQYNITWVGDLNSQVDFVNGFIENYGDPMGYRGAWEAYVNFKNIEATKRTQIISDNAQWFEDNSPVADKYKKKEVKGVSAKVITAAFISGDAYPATAIGINLPNADWIRKDHGSKSVTIENFTDAYSAAAAGDGFGAEFILRDEDRKNREQYGSLAGNLHTDLHECLGHGSGQLSAGTKGDELKNYGSPLEEARADLFALYYMGDQKLIELGLVPNMDVMKAEYFNSILNGMMTQLTRIQPGKSIEQAHMRCRQLIARWSYERGKADNVIELVNEGGKHYVVINDYDKLRTIFGELLSEIQRIKSDGDFAAGKALIDTYAVQVDPSLHAEVLERYAALNLEPYSGFVNPTYTLVEEDGRVVDVNIEYTDSYVDQMMGLSKNYSFLPTIN